MGDIMIRGYNYVYKCTVTVISPPCWYYFCFVVVAVTKLSHKRKNIPNETLLVKFLAHTHRERETLSLSLCSYNN